MKIYAFIFARGGSKGLPGKNIKPLAGKPLIAYSIESALASPSIDNVFVSTDDAEIEQVAIQCGAEVIVRPMALATDQSPEWLSWQHAINWVKDKHGEFDYFLSLPATSPLRAVCDIENAIDKITTDDFDVCISVTNASRSPYFNMVSEAVDGSYSVCLNDNGAITRRQDAPVVYDITTVVYAAQPQFILNNDSLFSGKVGAVKIPKSRAVDIDDIYDFYFAESLLGLKDAIEK
jgi:CMP-N-acetylneuraminic acid synthetase